MCVLVDLSFFLHLTESAFFWGGWGGGWDEAICFSAQALFGSAVTANIDEGILID